MKKKDLEYLSDKIKTSYEWTKRGEQSLVSHYTTGYFSDYIFFDYGKGSKVYDVDGNEFIDCSMARGTLILGHAHPNVIDAASNAIKKGSMHNLGNESEIRLAELLVESIPEAEIATFLNSGTEATLYSIKLARAYTNKEKIAKFEGHYHGNHEYAYISGRAAVHGDVKAPLSVPDYGGVPDYITDNVVTLSMNCPESLEIIKEKAEELAAVIVEPMPWHCPLDYKEFLKDLREVTKNNNVLLIFDEVMTGFRLGLGGASEYYGIVPDIAAYGCIIGGGFPVGAIVGKKEMFGSLYYDGFTMGRKKAFFTGTFSGNPTTCAAGAAVIEYLKDHKDIYADMERKTQHIRKGISEKAAKIGFPFQTRGAASFFVPYFFNDKIEEPRDARWAYNIEQFTVFRKHMLKNGINLADMGVVFISAAYSEEDCEKIIEAAGKSLEEMY